MSRHDVRGGPKVQSAGGSARRIRAGLVAILLPAGLVTTLAGPSRFGFSDRVERHLFPEVTTGPADPAWSPDGSRLAFSMQGDIWTVPAAGGEARAVTEGPWYYFEPAWSPDGQWIAFTVDTGGNLDIGVIHADGTALTRLTDDSAVDIEPVWSRDGRDVFFVSSRTRGFDIFRLHLDDRTVTPVVTGGGDQIQPAISPDGRTLAWVSPVRGRLGTGGIWTRPIDDADAEPTLVHYEESEYRMRPQWTRDGTAFVYGTDEMGSNDIATVPVTGGNPVVMTNDPMGEFSPAVAPDGRSLAFSSNRGGPMTLYAAALGGGPASSWRAVVIRSRRAQAPTGKVRIRSLDSEGRPVAARVQLVASDGRSYAPDEGFARVIAVSETHYFHADGEAEVTVPVGPVHVEALRGFAFSPVSAVVDVAAGRTTAVALQFSQRLGGESFGRWSSGDTHAHDLHQGRFGLTHGTLFLQSLAEDLNVSHVLIHMDGTRLMGRWADLTGEPHPLSTPTHILQFGQEFRGSLGHIGLLGVSRFVLPLIGGTPNTTFEAPASDLPYLDGAREQGGIAGFMHPYLSAGRSPAGWAGSLIPVDVALGRGDFYDVASLYSDELGSAELYYKLLNCGFRLPATGGTDNFPDVWRDPPPGTDRTYARVDGPLTVAGWLQAVKAGRTFATNGPLITHFTVDGVEAGGEVGLSSDGPAEVFVDARVVSIAPIERLEVVLNGEVAIAAAETGAVATSARPGPHEVAFRGTVAVPDGGWIAVRVIGPAHRYVADSYAFAHSSPIYVTRAGRPAFVSPADARYLAGVVEAIRSRADRSAWPSEAARAAFMREVEAARAAYLRLAAR